MLWLYARRAILAAGQTEAVAGVARRYGPALGAWRFVAGESLEDGLRAVVELERRGFLATLDILGEAVRETGAARRAHAQYVEALVRLAERGLKSHVSVKLTQLGLDVDEGLCLEHVADLALRAAEAGTFVRIDMEDSRYTEATLRVFEAVRRRTTAVGVVLQAYLYRTEADIERLHRFAADLAAGPASGCEVAVVPRSGLPSAWGVLNVRFCKGAYSEPPELAFPRKADVDANFSRLVRRHLEAGHFAAIATHDERLIEELLAFIQAAAVPADRWEVQMLYGIRRDLQERLLARGHRVRIYVPCGSDWYRYFLRRVAERPANLSFVLASLVREALAPRQGQDDGAR